MSVFKVLLLESREARAWGGSMGMWAMLAAQMTPSSSNDTLNVLHVRNENSYMY